MAEKSFPFDGSLRERGSGAWFTQRVRLRHRLATPKSPTPFNFPMLLIAAGYNFAHHSLSEDPPPLLCLRSRICPTWRLCLFLLPVVSPFRTSENCTLKLPR